MQQILPQIAREQQAGRDCVLVTLISSNGSAPRKAGSQMLAGGAGLLAGTIGGGAVEGHSLELAARLRVERRSDVRRFPVGLTRRAATFPRTARPAASSTFFRTSRRASPASPATRPSA